MRPGWYTTLAGTVCFNLRISAFSKLHATWNTWATHHTLPINMTRATATCPCRWIA